MSDLEATNEKIRRLVVDTLRLDPRAAEAIRDDTPLFGKEMGLDSIDALELVVSLEKAFGVRIESDEVGRDVPTSVSSLTVLMNRKLRESVPDGAVDA